MSIVSLNFFAFSALAALIYFLFPKKNYQWTILLIASYAYYFINCNKYIIYLVVTTLTTYLAGIAINKISDKSEVEIKANKEIWNKEEKKKYKAGIKSKQKLILILTLVFNFGILAFLKYFSFLASSLSAFFSNIGLGFSLPDFKLIIPLGISFYTFQSMGYIIDVYRKKVSAEKNIAKFALFVSFFPQIVQGPIGIYSDLAHQLYKPRKFDYEKFKSGGILIFWGLFKKLVIADRAVAMINTVTDNYQSFSGIFILMAAVMYALQLYADFSGGIDVCRGIAEIFGITMAENFKRPYFSKTLTEYWHRWHITLGDWLRNYLFYPISISKPFLKMGKALKAHNLRHLGKILPTSIASLITFIVIGIWHGAAWKYVMFGVWNGVVIMLASLLQPFNDRLIQKFKINKKGNFYAFFAMIRTFILVLIGYYFDIAKDLGSALKMLWLSVADFRISDLTEYSCLSESGLDAWDYIAILLGGLIILIISCIQEKRQKSIRELLSTRSIAVQWPVYIALIMTVALMGYYGPGTSPAEFVYMQF